jgi:hypothetical protein
MAAVDLVDGPGEELLILRAPNHGSPPVGLDVKIWRVAQPEADELFQSKDRVAGHLWPLCAAYRTRALIDLDTAKPRSVALQPELGAADGCAVVVERTLLTEVTRSRVLLFDVGRRQYAESF